MSAYVSTFKRIEKKYRLSMHQMRQLSAELSPYIEVDEYGVSRIDSLYLDTPDYAMVAASIEKPLYKEKLRIRAYGDIGEAACVFVEMKKKYDGVVYKRRVKTSREAAKAWLAGALSYEDAVRAYPVQGDRAGAEQISDEALSWTNRQIAREIEAVAHRWGPLSPSVLISCNRAAYRTRFGVASDVRVTFDSGIVYSKEAATAPRGDLPLSRVSEEEAFKTMGAVEPFRGSFRPTGAVEAFRGRPLGAAAPLLDPGETLMEVKCAGAMPLWLSRALADARAYPSSFSKYGAAYQRIVEEERDAARRAQDRCANAYASANPGCSGSFSADPTLNLKGACCA